MTQNSTRSNVNLPANYQIPANPPSGSRPRSAPSGRTVRTQSRVQLSGAATISRSTVHPQVTMATENFQINPFHGDFNPGTVHGQKIFERKTKGLPENERLTLTKKDGPNFRRLVESKSGEFGKCVTSIPIEIDNAGVTVKTASILEDYALISLERCQRQAHNRYSTALAETDPIPTDAWKTQNIDPAANNDDKKSFYDRVHSQVVAEWL